MRSDIFQERKCVHVRLTKEIHAAFRGRLFKYNVSMQDAFDEFAKQVAEGTRTGVSIIETLVNRKINDEIEGRSTTQHTKRREQFGELDVESLYHIINRKDK